MPPADQHISGELAQELGRHARLLHMLKARMAGGAPGGLDGAALGLLMGLVKCGPTRQGELAERSMLDPSTVSRYVGQLVKGGLVSRRADPADGRAVQLVATEQGLAIGAQVAARREDLVSTLLANWTAEDAHTLVQLLRRLNDEMDHHREGHLAADSGRPT
jgi:DNA-binding MarR family transcriptional regulator